MLQIATLFSIIKTVSVRNGGHLAALSSFEPPNRPLARLIDGRLIAKDVRQQVKSEVQNAAIRFGRVPKLGVVLVGDRSDSARYVSLKQRAAKNCGIDTTDVRLSGDAREADVLRSVLSMNRDPSVDGVLVQLPLPPHLDQAAVLSSISVDKDVDGFHPQNLGALARFGESYRHGNRIPGVDTSEIDLEYEPLVLDALGMNSPCTALGCIELLDRSGIALKGKHVVVVGRSNVVGLPLALLCLHRDATTTVCHAKTPQGDEDNRGTNIKQACGLADVLVVAAGVPGLVKGEWIKPGAAVIDVGFNIVIDDTGKENIVGDVCFSEASKVASHITPVPGGVGPMTVAMLMKNTLLSFIRRQEALHQ